MGSVKCILVGKSITTGYKYQLIMKVRSNPKVPFLKNIYTFRYAVSYCGISSTHCDTLFTPCLTCIRLHRWEASPVMAVESVEAQQSLPIATHSWHHALPVSDSIDGKPLLLGGLRLRSRITLRPTLLTPRLTCIRFHRWEASAVGRVEAEQPQPSTITFVIDML